MVRLKIPLLFRIIFLKICPVILFDCSFFFVLTETGQLLVRNRRSGVLREPRPGAEDEPVGQVGSRYFHPAFFLHSRLPAS